MTVDLVNQETKF